MEYVKSSDTREIFNRRIETIKYLCYKKSTTIPELAERFGVSERTMQRDIIDIRLWIPLDVKSGRYGGGVSVVGNFQLERMYMYPNEIVLLKHIRTVALNRETLILDDEESKILDLIIEKYEKPNVQENK